MTFTVDVVLETEWIEFLSDSIIKDSLYLNAYMGLLKRCLSKLAYNSRVLGINN